MKKNIKPLYHFGVPPVLILTGVRLALEDWPENWLLDCETFALGMMHLHQNRRWVRDSLMLFSLTAPPPDKQDDDAVGACSFSLRHQGAQIEFVEADVNFLVLANRLAWRRASNCNQALVGDHGSVDWFTGK